ncbi:MAG: heavy-metal-associated domain-containing protein [Planctomycetota bacterium]|nr:MAG: heavy-metal-associated domain-containing protein [Planctomycetota bacterium]
MEELEGIRRVEVEFEKKRVLVYAAPKASVSAMLEALKKRGYRAKVLFIEKKRFVNPSSREEK